MRKNLLFLFMMLPFAASAQVSNPESVMVPLSQAGWAAIASSAQSSGEPAPSGPAAAGIDGDPTTFWSSTWGTSHAHTYNIDMGATQSASMIYIIQRNSANNNIKDMKLYISTDTVSAGWTQIGSVHTLNPTTTSAGRQYIDLGSTQSFRYFKIETIINWGLYNHQNGLTPSYNDPTTTIAEAGVAIGQVPDNTVYSRAGWAGSACSEELVGEGAINGRFSAAIDNDPSTFWHSTWYLTPDYVYPHTLTFDMGVAQPVNVISYVQRNTGSSSAHKGKIRFSADGLNWSLPAVWDWNNNVADTFKRTANTVINKIILPAVQNYRYFRVEIDSNLSSHRFPADAATNPGGFYPSAMAEIRAHYEAALVPVKLTSFTGQLNNKVVHLNWKTAGEQNSAYFDVMRSADGSTFSAIGRLNAAGNTSGTSNYALTDVSPKAGLNYYQLKQVDLDGTSSLSGIVLIKNGIAGKGLIVKNIHTTSAQSVQIQVHSDETTSASINIFNATGNLLSAKTVHLLYGSNNVAVPFTGAGGVYVVAVYTAQSTTSTKFIK